MWEIHAFDNQGREIIYESDKIKPISSYHYTELFKYALDVMVQVLNGDKDHIKLTYIISLDADVQAKGDAIGAFFGRINQGVSPIDLIMQYITDPRMCAYAFELIERMEATHLPERWISNPVIPATLQFCYSLKHNGAKYFKNTITEEGHSNQIAYAKLVELAQQLKEGSKLITVEELYFLIQEFKVEGIEKLALFNSNQLRNERFLFIQGFPCDLIPSSYLCTLTYTIMTQPTCERGVDAYVEKTAFDIALAESKPRNTSPFTRNLVQSEELIVNEALADEINLFVEKVGILYESFKLYQYSQAMRVDIYNAFHQLVSDCHQDMKAYRYIVDAYVQTLQLFALYKFDFNIRMFFEQELSVSLEHLLRRICFKAETKDLNSLISLCQTLNIDLDFNSVASESKRTPMHWLVIGANKEKSISPTATRDYLACYNILLAHGADASLEMLDNYAGKNRTPHDYDDLHLFDQLLASQSSSFVP